MFNKISCKKCGNRVSKKHRFCFNCGNRINNHKEEDWGLLGKTDSFEKDLFQDSFFGGFGDRMMNNMLGTAMKMLEKEMQREIKSIEKTPSANVRLLINGKEIRFNEPQMQRKRETSRRVPRSEFKEKQLKVFSELPKEEPKTNLKRFGDKIIYELDMPETKSFEDILINKLENSIEIKAIGKTKAYVKVIPINMPIINQKLMQGKLILELQED